MVAQQRQEMLKGRNILILAILGLLICERQADLIQGGGGGMFSFSSLSSFTLGINMTVSAETTKDEQQPRNHKAKDERMDNPQFCTRDEIRNKGYWKSVVLPETPYIPTVSREHSCYNGGGSRAGELLQKPFRDTQWAIDSTTTNCIYHSEFDVGRFCQVVGNRSIGFLGDSITWQQYNSLAYLTQAVDEKRAVHNYISNACDGNSKMYWLRHNSAKAEVMHRMIRELDPEIIVFNRGAHFTQDTALLEGLRATLEVLMDWQQNCDERGRVCVLFWRTTAPGFPNCQNTPGPLTNRTMAETVILDNTTIWYAVTPKAKTFQWWLMPPQNRVVERFFQEYMNERHLRLEFLDFYDMAILRPDNHIDNRDCLHWCLPGPMDAANTLLLNRLEALSSAQ